MDLKKLIFSVSFLFMLLSVNGQTNNNKSQEEISFPTESVFIHYNSTLLFSGETLYYKFYCINNLSKKLSNISKVAYVELIGEDERSVFKHKIKLENGQGSGDFLLPTSVVSGNYKLIGYTLWMNNNDIDKFSQADLKIINPYIIVDENVIDRDSINTHDSKISKPIISKNYELKLHNKTFKTREKVQFDIIASKQKLSNVSISVCKVNEIKADSPLSSSTFFDSDLYKTLEKTIAKKTITQLPEMRGELLKGSLVSEKYDVSNKNIAFSMPSGGLLIIIKTNADGKFNFSVKTNYYDNVAYFQVLDDNSDDYSLKLDPLFNKDYSILDFDEFEIHENDTKKILKRSIQNQIDNAYLFTKSDSILMKKSNLPFDDDYDLIYNLDDYNRFSDMRETFIEIINQAQINTVSKDNFQFVVLNPIGSFDRSLPPLLVIDGIIIKDPNLLVNYNAKKIKYIEIIKDKYFLGSDVFNGVISFKTINKDFYKNIDNSMAKKLELYSFEDIKYYKSTSYQGNLLNEKMRIPDYRRQLYWNPRVKLSGNINNFTFYTSDNTGEFEIRVEGFTEQGEPISLSSTFTVIEE